MRGWTKVVGLSVIAAAVATALAGMLWFSLYDYTFTAARTRVVYDDVERFESVIARLPSDERSWPIFLDEEYLARGTRGLRRYQARYGLTGELLANMVAVDRRGWRSCRLTNYVRAVEGDIRRGLAGFEALYPRALFPAVFFVVGRHRAGGMNEAAGIVVAAELYRDDLTNCNREATHTSSEIPCLVVHELVHFNQATRSPIDYFRPGDNLARAVKEGSADFLAELAVGCHINAEAHAWGRAREAELWQAFQKILDSRDGGDWFYVKPEGQRPQDLGYFVGYNIVRAFYERAADKERAVQQIMNIADYGAFLAESGYAGGN